MKNANITIPFEDEKLQALRLFAGKKDADIDSELGDAIQKLYEKYVPKDARELVEMMAGADMPRGKAAVKKAVPAKMATVKREPIKDGLANSGILDSGTPGSSAAHGSQNKI